MSSPLGIDTTAMIQALIENAKRLGLIWTLRLATVVDGSDPTAINATYDGDTAAIDMTSMIGSLAPSERVYVLQVPPSGNFIAGSAASGGIYRARQLLTATAASVVFSGIPTNLRSLQLRWKARSDTAALIAAANMQINASGAAVYTSEDIQGNGAAVTASATIGAVQNLIGFAAAATSPAGLFGSGVVEFASWDRTSTFLTWTYSTGVMSSGAVARTGAGIFSVVGPWTSITITPGLGSWIAESDFQLEGIYS